MSMDRWSTSSMEALSQFLFPEAQPPRLSFASLLPSVRAQYGLHRPCSDFCPLSRQPLQLLIS